MYFRDPLFLRCVLLLLLALGWSSNASAVDVGTSEPYREQRLETWGTSLAWWGDYIGGWTNQQAKSDVLKLIFDSPNHLGLNSLRYNIGGGQNRLLAGNFRPGAFIPGWVPTAPSSISDPNTWVWDWGADPRQRGVLDEALARGVNQVDAFSNSPPYWMTISQDTAGAVGGGDNLLTSNYDEFAHYTTEVVKHFRDELGIRFGTLEAMNEPSGTWWEAGGAQEGNHVSSGYNQRLLIETVGQTLASKGIDQGLAAPDEVATGTTVSSYNQFNSYTKSFITQINTHTYGSSTSAEQQLRNTAANDGKRLLMSEYGNNSTGGLSGGINLANRITADLNVMGAQGWTYWQVVEPISYAFAGWGLVHADHEQTGSQYNIRQQYHVMRQFTSYIRPGSHILDLNEAETVGAYDPITDTTVLVLTNDETTADAKVYNLLDQTPAFTRVIQTISLLNYGSLGPADVLGNQITANVPGTSVTTIVIHHRANQIGNANFSFGGGEPPISSTLSGGWKSSGSAHFDSSVDNTSDGSGGGVLETDGVGNSGAVWQEGIGDSQVDLTGVAYQFSLDMMLENNESLSQVYDADTHIALEFYGADGQTLVHASVLDFSELLSSFSKDTVFRTHRTAIVPAPAGTRFVRPSVRFDNVGTGSNGKVYLDNAYLQEARYVPRAKAWTFDGNANWSDDANWQEDALIEKNVAIYFGPVLTQNRTITLGSELSVTEVTFDSEFAYRILGAGTLRVENPGSTARIDVRDGDQTLLVPVVLDGDATIQLLPGTSLGVDLSLQANGHRLEKTGAGQLSLSSSFTLGGGTLAIEAGLLPSITIGANSALDGTLEVSLPIGEQAEWGDIYQLIAFTDPYSDFDSVVLPALDDLLTWEFEYSPELLTAQVMHTADFNRDGTIDGADLAKWESDYGINGESDANGDGNSDGADFLIWQQHAGTSNMSPFSAAVPEPAAAMLFLAGCSFIFFSQNVRGRAAEQS